MGDVEGATCVSAKCACAQSIRRREPSRAATGRNDRWPSCPDADGPQRAAARLAATPGPRGITGASIGPRGLTSPVLANPAPADPTPGLLFPGYSAGAAIGLSGSAT